MSKKKGKELIGSTGLYDDHALWSITCLGTKETATLLLGQDFWEGDGNGASLFKLTSDGTGTEIEIPIGQAEILYHCLGTILDKD